MKSFLGERGTAADSSVRWPSKDRIARTIRQKLVAHGILVRAAGSSQRCASPRSEMPQRVLIADDYSDAAESLAMLLRLAGFETQVATRGDDALLQALRWRPHICVLEIDMPGCYGREIARSLRQQSGTQGPLLIALTAWTSDEDRHRTLEAGFDYYFLKPVEPERLVRTIEQGM